MARGGVNARVTGTGHAIARILALPGNMKESRAEILRDWAEDVQDGAKRRVPQRTGNLHDAIDKRVYETQGVAYVGVYNPDELEYAEYIEKGTSSIREEPYLVPAFEASRAQVVPAYRAELRRHLGGE
jgi:HK97 gp10 family phage protein